MLPQHVIAMRTMFHTSTRQPRRVRPNWVKTTFMTNTSPRPTIHGATGTSLIIKNAHLIPCQTGPLSLNEYRFWRAGSGKGWCRSCTQGFETPKERMEHQKLEGCTRKLVEAYKLLLRDMRCVVCDKTTKNTKWGIPLCDNGCVFRWQFEIGAGTYAVHTAIQLHDYQTGGAK